MILQNPELTFSPKSSPDLRCATKEEENQFWSQKKVEGKEEEEEESVRTHGQSRHLPIMCCDNEGSKFHSTGFNCDCPATNPMKSS